ncbi:hypothetical protein BC937DRAFT_86435 [Endogone sp. FLAS-F59071]|nr:hypothetical protein BC937DRAFT_86435 [Endogone sp. FLAS-F59071]|eukprot:RUS13047.1 hypothetical protein BC937DRAFT_86435 [Endogone sp. FLAS-F59071]
MRLNLALAVTFLAFAAITAAAPPNNDGVGVVGGAPINQDGVGVIGGITETSSSEKPSAAPSTSVATTSSSPPPAPSVSAVITSSAAQPTSSSSSPPPPPSSSSPSVASSTSIPASSSASPSSSTPPPPPSSTQVSSALPSSSTYLTSSYSSFSYIPPSANVQSYTTLNGTIATAGASLVPGQNNDSTTGSSSYVITVSASVVGGVVVLAMVGFVWRKVYRHRREGWDDEEILHAGRGYSWGPRTTGDPFKSTLDQYHRSRNRGMGNVKGTAVLVPQFTLLACWSPLRMLFSNVG